MPKWLKICLWVAAAVVYMNIGYLFVYSLDSTASQTALSNFVYKTVDFMGASGKMTLNDITGEAGFLFVLYGIIGLSWPLLLPVFWMVNFLILLWEVLLWSVTGGFWKWLGLLK